MYVFHRFLVLTLIQFGFAALVCKNSEADDRPKHRRRKQHKGNTSPVWGMTGIGAGVAVGVLAGAGVGSGVLPGVGCGVIARGILMRCFLGDACILHNDSLKLTGGQHGKGNAFRKLIAIGGGDSVSV